MSVSAGQLRAPDLVMAPARVGAARLTRYSFNRMLIRRIGNEGWRVSLDRLELDCDGRGHAVYRVDANGWEFNFVAFTTTVAEDEQTDRVVASAWEITGALVQGSVSDEYLAELAQLIPLQEDARLDARVLVLTRGNRSVRFYDYLVGRLATGQQPDPDRVADAGYIMRSTAFYGNGKYGMRSFLGYEADHPLRAPYRAQMLAAWLFRELSYDSVETCARLRGGDAAVEFSDQWRTYFGLGNATGLGLVPYFVKHPRVMHGWFELRERALAAVRAMPADPDRLVTLDGWIARGRTHFATLGNDDRAPWCNPTEIADRTDRVAAQLAACRGDDQPFDALYLWAESQDVETTELVVSLLIELDDSIQGDVADEMLFADETVLIDPTLTVSELRLLLHDRFGWIDDLALSDSQAVHHWWVVSDNTEEPRRAVRSRLAPENRDVAIDVPHQVLALRTALDTAMVDDAGGSVARFITANPEHDLAVRRVVGADQPYGEVRDNPCARSFLPLDTQRFQLAMYGMDNFSPKSTDWLRVTLNQGAPRARLTAADRAAAVADNWVWPARPDRSDA